MLLSQTLALPGFARGPARSCKPQYFLPRMAEAARPPQVPITLCGLEYTPGQSSTREALPGARVEAPLQAVKMSNAEITTLGSGCAQRLCSRLMHRVMHVRRGT
jgi:hypothetical protein